MPEKNYDFCGWATRNNILCADGRTIRQNAFADCDGATVPLVWNHVHSDPTNVLGHALLENRPEGVFTYGWFNDTQAGQDAKELVKHGDIKGLSIYANRLKQNGGNVLHGVIREVSLVLAGANPGATIESVMVHGEEDMESAIFNLITEDGIELAHSEENEEANMADKEKTVQDVFDELTDEQKTVVYALIGAAVEDAKGSDGEVEHSEINEGDDDVMYNVFENDNNTLTHSEQMAVFADTLELAKAKS